ncbi:TPA: DUF4917 family protein [Legionella pneumophila]|nr:DUF4917 family protein [Legionella pneumophila]
MSALKPSILLGNGFNGALKAYIGSNVDLGYETISRNVLLLSNHQGDGLSKFLIKNQHENDLELLLSILENSIQCLKSSIDDYCICTKNFKEIISEHKKNLKEYVINTFTNYNFHPKYQSIFVGNNVDQCAKNLEKFDRIFTINYDLILYWLLNNKKLLIETNKNGEVVYGKFRDGFTARNECKPYNKNTKKPYENLFGFPATNNKTNVFFLHGALHLIQKDGYTYKVIRGGSKSHLNLIRLRKVLLKDYEEFDNLIVFNATSYEKIKNIYSNVYLEMAYDKIITTSNDIVIYGVNILDSEEKNISLGNDAHLWRRLINSKSHRLIIGISKSNVDELNHFAKKLAFELQSYRCKDDSDIKIHCFPQKQINIWQCDNFYQEILNTISDGYSAGLKKFFH